MSEPAVVVGSARDDLRKFKPSHWYVPGQAGMIIHADGSVEVQGEVHPFDPDCCYRGCDNCPTWNKKKNA